MLSAARVNIICILSCIKVASIASSSIPFCLFCRSSLRLFPSSVFPQPTWRIYFLTSAHFSSPPFSLSHHCLLFALPVSLHHPFSPVSSSLRIYRSLSEPWLLLYPSPCSPPPYPSLLSSSPLIRIHLNIHFHSSLTISVLKFTFASSILCPFMNFSFFFVLSLSVCSLILLAHHSVPACLSGSIHSCTSAGSRQHERWLKNSFEVMKRHCKGSFTHDILRCNKMQQLTWYKWLKSGLHRCLKHLLLSVHRSQVQWRKKNFLTSKAKISRVSFWLSPGQTCHQEALMSWPQTS